MHTPPQVQQLVSCVICITFIGDVEWLSCLVAHRCGQAARIDANALFHPRGIRSQGKRRAVAA